MTAPLILPDDAYNRELVAHVHPPGRVNPTPAGRYQLVVLGGGTAGLVSAMGAAALGAKVALVERHLLGGDCLNTGCVPSKALIAAARAVADARRLGAFGARATVEVDFPAVMERLRRLRAEIAPHDGVERLTGAGVDVFLGDARFVSRDAVEVGGARLMFSRAVIATGARAASLPVPGLAEAAAYTNETIFNLTELPTSLVVIGAGPIGCELAQSFARLGSTVTIVSLDDQVMPREDADAAAVVAVALVEDGVALRLGAKLLRVDRAGGTATVVFERAGVEERVSAAGVLVAVGRAPNVEGLGLDVAGVAVDRAGVVVDDFLRTANPHIFAAGDVCSPLKFTHAADAMARIVIQNALFPGRARVSRLVVPWCTYTEPEVAHVGLTEADARKQGVPCLSLTLPLHDVDRAVLEGDTRGFARLNVHPGTGRVLGATLVGRNAGDMIGPAVLAMTAGISASTLARTIAPYPTQGEIWKRLGDAWQRTRFTARVEAIVRLWLRWMR
ncbi:MAG: mercuric reductase [Pseudomonadota bacterium]|nr:mercuric reductase [Pseudomonadota bacterium]